MSVPRIGWPFVLGGWLGLYGCDSADRMRIDVNASAVARPAITVDPLRHDFGQVTQHDTLSHDFTLTNTGAAAISLAEFPRGHSCAGRVEPFEIAPRQSARVRVTCQPKLYGPFFDALAVAASSTEAPLRIELAAHAEPLLVFERELLELRLPFRGEAVETVALRGVRARDAHLEVIDDGNVGFALEVIPGSSERPQALRIHWKGSRVGRHGGRILLATGLEQPREVELQFLAEVIGTLSVSPTNPYFNLHDARAQHVVEVRSSEPGFTVTSVATEGPFSASIERADQGHYRIRVSVERERLQGDRRGASGTLVIRSNDPTEPEKRLPLFGFGKPGQDG